MTTTPGDDENQPQPEQNPPNQPPGPEHYQPGYWEQKARQQGRQGVPYPPQPGYSPQPGYPQQPGYSPEYPPDHPRATTVLVLGILSLVACGFIGPFAWVMGKRTLEEIDASQGAMGGRGAANAGYILGIVATVLLGLGLLVGLGLVLLLTVGSVSTTTG